MLRHGLSLNVGLGDHPVENLLAHCLAVEVAVVLELLHEAGKFQPASQLAGLNTGLEKLGLRAPAETVKDDNAEKNIRISAPLVVLGEFLKSGDFFLRPRLD